MIDYNDGKWHPHDGKGCPVHGKTIVQVQMRCEDIFEAEDSDEIMALESTSWVWDGDQGDLDFIAFRVIEEIKGPREFWAFWSSARADWLISDSEIYARNHHPTTHRHPVFRVREVLE